MLFAPAIPSVAGQTDGFSTALVYSYIAFNRKRTPGDLDGVVHEVLQYYLGNAPVRPWSELPGSTRLRRDLGCGVQTVADSIGMIEQLFSVSFSSADIAGVETLDDLRRLARGYVIGVGSAA
jgi:hypothetical protein